jgi:hypothetical protein
LSSSGEELIVPILSSAKINLFVQPAAAKNGVAPVPYYQPVQFSDIKIGDRLNISLILAPDNNLEGQTVYIFASAPGN